MPNHFAVSRRHVIALATAIIALSVALGALSVALGGARPASKAPRSAEASEIVAIAQNLMREQSLAGLILRVDRGDRQVVRIALGESMTGVPATPDMRFRMGSESIPYITTLLLRLQEQGRLDLDDPLSKYLPDSGVPNADRVTLRMLGHAISGYPDWIQGNPAFVDILYANPFRLWTDQELLDHAFAQPLICEPGACFHYAHTNFLLLGQVLTAVTGKPFAELVRERILRPLGLDDTISRQTAEIPEPALHAYGKDRGPYEDTTSWSPSWGLGDGQLMVSTIDDVTTTAREILSGAHLSPASERQFVARPPVIDPPVPGLSFGLGLLLAGDWRLQNPYVNNYGGMMAYLPEERLAVSAVATKGINATFDGSNPSETLLVRIAQAITPEHPVQLQPG
jgi:CubicO group peptidase (beta-lactamase class C family)